MKYDLIYRVLKSGNGTDEEHVEHHTISEIVEYADPPLQFAWIFGGILCFLSLVFFFFQLHRHLTAVEPYRLYKPKSTLELPKRSSQTPEGWLEGAQNDRTAYAYKRHAILMVFMIPVFSVTAYLSMFLLRIAVVLEFIRAIYEAVILYVFLLVMANMLGGLKKAPSVLMKIPKGKYLAVPPLACCFRPCCPQVVLTPNLFRLVRFLVLQYAVVKPVTILLALILYFGRHYETGDEGAYQVLRVVGIISVLLSAYGLFIMYKATHELLAEYSTGLKFATIKAIVLLAAIQGTVIQWIVEGGTIHDKDHLSAEEQGEIWNNFLLTVEMFLISFLFYKAFPMEDYRRGVIGISDEQVEEAVKEHPNPDEEARTPRVVTMDTNDDL